MWSAYWDSWETAVGQGACLQQEGEDFAGFAFQVAVDPFGDFGLGGVDFDHDGTGFLGDFGEAGGGLDYCGSPDHQKDFRLMRYLRGNVPFANGERFAKPDDTGAGHGAAFTEWGQRAEVSVEVLPFAVAVGAAEGLDVAVEQQEIVAAGARMEAVDVLRDEREVLEAAFHFR